MALVKDSSFLCQRLRPSNAWLLAHTWLNYASWEICHPFMPYKQEKILYYFTYLKHNIYKLII